MRNKFILVAAACCTLLAASAAGSTGSGEASPAPAPEKKWLVPEAEYRLSVQPELPAEATSVDMRRQVLPVLPENGVRVFDDAGNPVPFQFHDNYSLSIAPAPKAKAFDIYFGFKEKQPADTWKPESGVRPPPSGCCWISTGAGTGLARRRSSSTGGTVKSSARISGTSGIFRTGLT